MVEGANTEYAGYSSSSATASCSSDDSDSDSDTDSGLYKKKKKSRRKDEIDKLNASVSQLATALADLKTHMTKQEKKGITCYNCKKVGHGAGACTSPCKYCSGSHKHFECSKHPKNINATKPTTNTAMLIQSSQETSIEYSKDHKDSCMDMYAIRGREDDDEDPGPLRRKQRADDDAEEITRPANNTMHANQSHDTPENDNAHLSDLPLSAKELINRLVYQVSLAQLADIAPSFCTQSKAALTKPHRKTRGTSSSMLQVETVEQDIVLKSPTGDCAPRAVGMVNGRSVNMILDGGCVPCIISTRLAHSLDLEIGHDYTSLIFGDGSGKRAARVKSIVSISVGPSKTIDVPTLCLDVPSYDFVVGREAFASLNIGTDWGRHFWYTMSSQGFMPLSVQYTPIPSSDLVLSHDLDENECSKSDDDGLSDATFMLCLEDNEEDSCYSHMLIDKEESSPFDTMISKIQARSDLGLDNKNSLISVLLKHKGAFGDSYADVTQTDLVTFHVDTGDAKPIYKRPYPHMSHSELACLKEELQTMVANGILIPAMHARFNSRNGGWSFPCRYVAKKDGSRRLVTQFQDLNKVTVRDPWPLPSIQDLLEQFTGASLFSTMDLLKGFHQIAMDPDSVTKLTITTPFGCYSYRVMPFGVINGPSCFSRAIHLALEPFLNRCAAAYIDDVTVYSSALYQHIRDLDDILARFEEVKMKCSSKKCDFIRKRIEFLGFIVMPSGVTPLPSRLQQIQDFPRPSNATAVRAFLGLANFYRRHVQAFADLSSPLTSLTSKRARFVWDDGQEKAFQIMKDALSKSTLLIFPDPNKQYHVFTDASDIGIGVVLSQEDEEGMERPVCFLSRKLKPAEVRYPVVERELLAVIYALQKLRRYLLDKTFILFTDNTAVRYLFAKADPNMRL